jgi:hypothetical protein
VREIKDIKLFIGITVVTVDEDGGCLWRMQPLPVYSRLAVGLENFNVLQVARIQTSKVV